MSFSDEEIIAFLLGDADAELAGRIRACLPNDPDLVDRVSHYREVLNHLDGVAQRFEPPADLVDRTMARIDELPLNELPQESHEEIASEELVQPASSVACLSSPIEPSTRRRSWFDSAALTISLVVLCSLTIPAMVRARYESRRAQCAYNLRETGSLMFDFAMRQPDRRYPFVAKNGPEAFAGVYVVRLMENGLLPPTRTLRCASMVGMERVHQPAVMSSVIAVPSLEQLHQASQQQLECWQCSLGGDYAYNLGVFEDDELVAPKNVGSSHFAILADAPWFEDDVDQLLAHDGKGINILYDDGQVRFVRSDWITSRDPVADHPFRNLRGDREAGIGISDASLAPSQFPPIAH
ncbi:MAG: hypothetical protein U0930_02120 [Pirellulales bacterium]